MSQLLHQLLLEQAEKTPDAPAIGVKSQWFDYRAISSRTRDVAAGLQANGLLKHERVAVYLPKTLEAVCSYFGTTAAGGVMVPVNPILKAPQVEHILADCNARVLITNKARYKQMQEHLPHCPDLKLVVLVDSSEDSSEQNVKVSCWSDFIGKESEWKPSSAIDADMAAILYTSGSTGKPKGVVLSHRNMVTGAHSVAEYLKNDNSDKLLCVLPFSFDYGFSQLTTAFSKGAACYLLEYLLPRDIVKAVCTQGITGLALVPPLWVQLAGMDWPSEAGCLRYFTNSGGAMPTATLNPLREKLPNAAPYLMYGLTEAFRSSYLDPSQIDIRPTSMGKAIPNAELLLINDAGELCKPNEPGELVHRGGLVALGYWNDSERTAERYKPVPAQISGIPVTELAVWSGDIVRQDEEGYLYFVGRRDDMIKTSGYRVSPSELEEVVYSSGLVSEVTAIGIAHFRLGQAIVLVVVAGEAALDEKAIIKYCQQKLPAFMVPAKVIEKASLARNPNGKIDRKTLANEFKDLFADAEGTN
ncbi:acyl-CoA ligase (AMP-forming), exosortase A system-associated [Endozoicomonas sp. OPT23]|uniref:acyl-CoA ligase (AMP-forming), exosortase A system-associated n=1 Tax=Endozoicomonas sp. OPT23 TaxID=2072845 RepID=UPI00129B22E6|nr:acyl-CoA ligase (AMP-forming), exosortase A system-associated [Endozoicomonas sp. OPT23]MRI31598.1 acyl-CoA ligase (AMP-forming), exosortase A system-associated [Endozoicomonas sp. OPT23]